MTQARFRGGIAGWPVGHSLSPVINAWWRREHGVTGSYEHLPCEGGEEEFRGLIARLKRDDFTGINVTIPHKENAYRAADTASDRAKALGVANTLVFSGGGVHADNTDEEGFHAAVMAAEPDRKTRALVLGAGGAAPAVCMALHRAGFETIDVTNRTRERAEALAARFGFLSTVVDWSDFVQDLSAYDLIVNTTSLGMHGQPPLAIDLSGVPDHMVVADIIYTPMETPLLAAAKARGLKTFNGLAMLAYQAVPGFEHWTGIRPTVTPELMAHLEDRLLGRIAPVAIALTGSIGMGKSTVADMFARLGAQTWNADEAVHRLYAEGGAAVEAVSELFPDVIKNGAVSRDKLSAHLLANPGDFPALEAVVHPLVAQDRALAFERAQRAGALACVMDIPLLFEKHLETPFQAVVVVTAAEAVRRRRVMDRPGMTGEKFNAIVARQMPESEKTARADYVVRTDLSLQETAAEVSDVYRLILEKYAY
ncbi:shikimate dehydrogenase [Aquisalinus flavus]|uniref:Multifunctional fusion protein n=1 Tax=Aquisalinus flavus TaxID=1526572 RepID=A0A8J2Y455_9PROT|nr:shikimate dehydrogenase [Aquisalinus flavus]MBD0425601.1 shikimate dehydrogenase [Aquisalinus flavus]UNE48780.1 shikimate dehydrogenase [Aquisalinus flavus]GGD14752.1 hypothetical protein GCM10011342_24410 [Aquisalinus flavus]